MSKSPTSIPTARALFSADGHTWQPSPGDGPVKKIVLGTLEEGKNATLSEGLRADLVAHGPTLTHLHLWHVADLTELPALPAGLECLDLRGCAALTALPDLPPSLRTLDLSGCAGLATLPREAPPRLERFYFPDCTALKQRTLENFLEVVKSAPLVEIDGSGGESVATLDELPTTLRKVVFQRCAKLTDVKRLIEMTSLDHLNLSGCLALREMSDLPASVRYLVLHGCENLEWFRGQQVGPYDRGPREGQNVARIFHSRRKFGDKLGLSAHAKLLLMGDGRVGKSTLAKRLQWDTLTQEERLERPELKPKDGENPTHKMHFWRWDAPLRLPEAKLAEIRERAEAHKLALPSAPGGDLAGAVRIWDFGGQEIYHNTHRIFAAEGSVFLLVWREAAPAWAKLASEKPAGCDDDEWREWNRQRPLDYWLDYIFSMRPNAQVALVCTCCRQGQPRLDWTTRAPRHAQTERGRNLPSFHVDLLEDGAATNPEYLRLVDWLKAECGREASRIGILQPAFFSQVADQVDAMLKENEAARRQEEKAPNLLLLSKEWEKRLIENHGKSALGEALDANDVKAISGYLHDAGQLFLIGHEGDAAVLIDQAWATDLIYEVIRPGGRLHRRIVKNGGWFALEDMEEEPCWKLLASDLQRAQLLRYMETSHVLVKMIDQEKSASGKTIFVANEKWLLPKEQDIRETLEAQMQAVRDLPDMDAQEKFSFEDHDISEFEFRDLMAHLGKRFGRYATWFRRGMQAMPDAQNPDWCFRLVWSPNEPESFLGKVDAVLVTRAALLERLAAQVEELFAGEGCPLARLGKAKRREASPLDLTHEFISPLTPGQEEVGVSSSGADAQEAQELVNALLAAGIRAIWYRLPECRSGEYAKVFPFMQKLGRSPAIILYLSDAYLGDDPEQNWYCLWELADAINRLADGRRSAARTLVIYKTGQTVNSRNLDDLLAPRLTKFAAYFARKYEDVLLGQRREFLRYNDFSLEFTSAWQDGNLGKFFSERGTLGTYASIKTKPDGSKDYAEVIKQVRAARREA